MVNVNAFFVHSYEMVQKIVHIALEQRQTIFGNCHTITSVSIMSKRGPYLVEDFFLPKRSFNIETTEP